MEQKESILRKEQLISTNLIWIKICCFQPPSCVRGNTLLRRKRLQIFNSFYPDYYACHVYHVSEHHWNNDQNSIFETDWLLAPLLPSGAIHNIHGWGLLVYERIKQLWWSQEKQMDADGFCLEAKIYSDSLSHYYNSIHLLLLCCSHYCNSYFCLSSFNGLQMFIH